MEAQIEPRLAARLIRWHEEEVLQGLAPVDLPLLADGVQQQLFGARAVDQIVVLHGSHHLDLRIRATTSVQKVTLIIENV